MNKIKFYDMVSHRSYYVERMDVDLKRTKTAGGSIIVRGKSIKDTPSGSGVIFATKNAVDMVLNTRRRDWK